MSPLLRVLLLVLHGTSAMLLIGAVTHQLVAVWLPPSGSSPGWWRSLRAVNPERYSRAVVVLTFVTFALGAIAYVPFRVLVRFEYLDARLPWATGLFEIKEHAAAIGLAVLPAYGAVWSPTGSSAARRAFTTFVAAMVWWSFLVGHIVNNARGL